MKTSTAHVLLSNLAYKGTARRYVITVIPGSSSKAISVPVFAWQAKKEYLV